jgi:hypothetical protein
MKRIRTGSPKETKRPFAPSMAAESDIEHVTDALDSIARSLSTIDHNLEALISSLNSIAHALPTLLKK